MAKLAINVFLSMFFGWTKGQQTFVLPNEECKVRPTLVTVDERYHYSPLVISLDRCTGVCGEDPPYFRRCVPTSKAKVHVDVLNKVNLVKTTIGFEKHTNCGCACVHNSSVCDPIREIWNPKKCTCDCQVNPNNPPSCPANYEWVQSYCRCKCAQQCTKRQIYNETDCTCTCKPYFYRKCQEKQRAIRESDCKCIKLDPKKNIGESQCFTLPTKWAAIVIATSFFAFFIFAFDCILFSRKSGCFYQMRMLLPIPRKKQDQDQPKIQSVASQDTLHTEF